MEKKTIVITGSTRGIGYGLAREFASQGHELVVNGRSDERVNQAVTELEQINSDVRGVSGCVCDEETHLKLVKESNSTFGKIDIWINNAGIPQGHEKFVNIESCEIKRIVETNIFGLMAGTKIAANYMINQGFGKVFNMEGFGSDGRMMDKLSLYGTTKKAVNYFTKSVSKELGDSCVQLGIISPGMVRTDFLSSSMASASEEDIKRFKKVNDILAEEVDVVCNFLAGRIIKSNRNYDRIEFLTKFKLMGKILRMMLSR